MNQIYVSFDLETTGLDPVGEPLVGSRKGRVQAPGRYTSTRENF